MAYEEITHLDLCSGIGGFALALADAGRRADRNVRTAAFCEPEQFCQQVLGKHWPNVPIYEDVKTFPKDFGKVSILTSGYPCQPFSQAGKRKGTADDRHIWPWVLEIVEQTRPHVCVFENVVGHLSMGIDEVLLSLSNAGYHAWPLVFGAVSKNAPHRRQRVWIIAYAHSQGEPDGSQHEQRMVANPDSGDKGRKVRGLACTDATKDRPKKQYKNQAKRLRDCSQDVADTQGARLQRWKHSTTIKNKEPRVSDTRTKSSDGRAKDDASKRSPAVSGLGRTFDGLSSWVDANWERGVPRVTKGQKDRAKRLKALGNAIVPQVASEIFTAIFESDLL